MEQAGSRTPGSEGGSRGDRTRAAVVAAARHRFSVEGFDGATGARIAADAGVSEPTIAFHFGSKAGLLVAVMRDYYDDLLDGIDDVVAASVDPRSRLRDFARWWVTHNAEYFELVSVFGRQGRRTDGDPVVDAFRACNRRVTSVFDRLAEDLRHLGELRPEVPARILRDAFFGACEHLMVGHALTGRPEDLAAAADDVVDLLMTGAGTHAAAWTGAAPLGRTGASDLSVVEAKLDRLTVMVEEIRRQAPG